MEQTMQDALPVDFPIHHCAIQPKQLLEQFARNFHNVLLGDTSQIDTELLQSRKDLQSIIVRGEQVVAGYFGRNIPRQRVSPRECQLDPVLQPIPSSFVHFRICPLDEFSFDLVGFLPLDRLVSCSTRTDFAQVLARGSLDFVEL
eukprot:709052-Hanusia_phi.AAC.2